LYCIFGRKNWQPAILFCERLIKGEGRSEDLRGHLAGVGRLRSTTADFVHSEDLGDFAQGGCQNLCALQHTVHRGAGFGPALAKLRQNSLFASLRGVESRCHSTNVCAYVVALECAPIPLFPRVKPGDGSAWMQDNDLIWVVPDRRE
jgi:hypothetical protein